MGSHETGSLPNTLMLYLVDVFTLRKCQDVSAYIIGQKMWQRNNVQNEAQASLDQANSFLKTNVSQQDLLQLGEQFLRLNATCRPQVGIQACESYGGTCRTLIDGYYVEASFCLTCGLVFFFLLRPLAHRLDCLPTQAFAFKFVPKSTHLDASFLSRLQFRLQRFFRRLPGQRV
ncbi:unnamed protein product [Protopolystoma xenopodis]|uniref:Uncharacterized protein n=1 Tax=Protopolystoma xenopodis TaxID=117903 RepID=A0A3S5FC92_9PLAT|nr:unnamed protein product [Protopolystoma xenopodis]